MFCSHCGAVASGNFCSVCGFALTRVAGGAVPSRTVIPAGVAAPAPGPEAVVPAGSWHEEFRYAEIIAVAEVRDRIAANAAAATTRLTGEQFLDLCDKAFKPLTGVSLSTVASIAAPIYARLGVRTGKADERTYARPVGQVLADVLCFLAKNGYGVREVQQGEDGCVLECTLPSDWRSFAGDLLVTVERVDAAVAVRAATKIPSQLYDWGKSRQILDRLFAHLPTR